MPIFVLFIFGAVVFGAGAMLSPAWPTRQPRIGMMAAFSLAIIVGGTVFYSALFGWDVLVIDYLLFALVVGIFLGGTLSIGQARAEKAGTVLEDKDQGWPGPQDLAMFAAFGLLLALPVLILPVPFGDAAQTYGYLALVTGQGGTFDTLAPFHPQISYLYAPGFSALTAYLSQQLNQGLHTIQFSVGTILALVNLWLAYDFGAELRNKRLGRAMALAMLMSMGLLGMLINGHFTALLGLMFVQAFLLFCVRYLRHQYLIDIVGAGLMLGATAYSSPGMTIIAGLGFLPWLAALWLAEPRPTLKTWMFMALGIPLVALVGIWPWLGSIQDLLRSDISSPFTRSADHLLLMLEYHGYWVAPVAALGGWLGWQRRDPVVILCMVWLFFIVDFSATGGIATLFPFVTRFVDPQGLAWHGPVIPLTILGGMGLLWLWESSIAPRLGGLNYRQSYAIALLIVIVAGGALLFQDTLREAGKRLSRQAGAFASEADVQAMLWIAENTPPDARLLNFPNPYEGQWAPVIARRDAVYFPPLPYMLVDAAADDAFMEQNTMLAFWLNPADPAQVELLAAAGIEYVIVPQIINNPASFATSWRWGAPPVLESLGIRSTVADAPYLERVFEQEGAEVYRVIYP